MGIEKLYEFKVELLGWGRTRDEAWEKAKDGFDINRAEPIEEAEIDEWNDFAQEEEEKE